MLGCLPYDVAKVTARCRSEGALTAQVRSQSLVTGTTKMVTRIVLSVLIVIGNAFGAVTVITWRGDESDFHEMDNFSSDQSAFIQLPMLMTSDFKLDGDGNKMARFRMLCDCTKLHQLLFITNLIGSQLTTVSCIPHFIFSVVRLANGLDSSFLFPLSYSVPHLSCRMVCAEVASESTQ